MKKQILTLLFVAAAVISSYAQCDKKSVLTSSVTEYLTSSGEIRKSVEEQTTIEFDSKTISIAPGDHTMEGTIDSISCDWKTPYKVGKTVINTSIASPDGRIMNAMVTIEGREGKITLLFEESPDRRIRITLDKFEEKK